MQVDSHTVEVAFWLVLGSKIQWNGASLALTCDFPIFLQIPGLNILFLIQYVVASG